MVGDPIADMLNRIKTASAVGHKSISVPFSKVKFAIAKKLEKQEYVVNVSKKGKKVTQTIEIDLVYEKDTAKIKGVERVSKPSKRVYFGIKDIKPFRNGYGAFFLSTPKGILTGEDARKQQVGGEVLFKIW